MYQVLSIKSLKANPQATRPQVGPIYLQRLALARHQKVCSLPTSIEELRSQDRCPSLLPILAWGAKKGSQAVVVLWQNQNTRI